VYKNLISKWVLVSFILISFCFTSIAETFNSDKYNISLLKNVPHSEINDIIQDDHGFMWFATLDGLYRYDGYNYSVYQLNNKPNSISSNMILCMAKDHFGNIWFSTYGRGISKLDVKTRKFVNYPLPSLVNEHIFNKDIVSMIFDKDGNLWMNNTMALFKIEFNDTDYSIKKTSYFYYDKKEGNTIDNLNCVYQDKYDNIWLGTNFRLFKLLSFVDGRITTKEYRIRAKCISENSDGLVIGGTNIYTLKYNKKEKSYNNIKLILDDTADDIIADNYEIWFGNRNGVGLLKKSIRDSWKVTLRLNKTNLPFTFQSNVITCLLKNSFNQICVGTRGAGAYYIARKTKKFYNYSPTAYPEGNVNKLTRALFEDSNKNLWIGDEENGVFLLKNNKYFYSKYKNIHVNVQSEDRAYAFEETKGKKDIVWVGTSYPTGLVAIDENSLEKIVQKKDEIEQIGFVFALKATSNHTLWAGTYNNGLYRLHIDDNGQILDKKQFTNENSYLSSNIIRSVYQDKNGNLWIGTDMGINRIKKKNLENDDLHISHSLNGTTRTNISQYYILEITEDDKGNMLFGTMGNGLLIYNPVRDSLKIISQENGLANGSVKSIVLDPNKKNLWLSTNRGISMYNPETGRIINYGKESGIKETEFCEICGIRNSSGQMIFGNRNGILVFKPEDINNTAIPPYLFLTDLYVNNKLIEVGDTSDNILPLSMEYMKQLNLKYSQHNFSIDFVGIQLNALNNIKYEYRLKGFDDKWITTNKDRRNATYTNLREGDYLFQVRAYNGNGIISKKCTQLKIHIAPPFSRSIVAYILYVIFSLLICSLAYYIASTFYKKQKEIYKVRLEKEKSDEINQYRFQFFTNVSHEFRTPLTLINIPLENLINQAKKHNNKEEEIDLHVIKQNSEHLMTLINQLLDFRKIEKGKEHFILKPVNLNQFINLFKEQFAGWASKKHIDFIYEYPSEDIIADIDKSMFEKVMYNLLSNAFKHTAAEGKIGITLSKQYEQIKITISDNGTGIMKKNLPYVFNKFYQGNESVYVNQEGSGIGLALCKSIIEQHKGTIDIESEENVGTKIFIHLKSSMVSSVEDTDYSLSSKTELMENYKLSSYHEIKYDDVMKKYVVLIVEDNMQLCNQIQKNLGDQYYTLVAENGQEGLETCIKHQPDIILTDIMMPVMNGIDMCVNIKKNEEISHIPIIVFTANNTVKNKIDSFNIGHVDAYIEKPFNMEALKSQMVSLLSNIKSLKESYKKNAIISPDKIAHTKTDLNFLNKIIAIINKNMSDPDFNVQKLAKEYSVSRTYLNNKIKALTGETANKFLRNIRLDYAAKLILQKELNISEISWKVGYGDISSFRIRFKERFGVTPTKYKG